MPGVGAATPPLPPATNAAPTTGGGATAPAAPAATTGAVAGEAGTGAAALAGGPTGSISAVLQQLVTTLQSVVAALGGAPVQGGGATASTAPGNSASQGSAFKAAAQKVVMMPGTFGSVGGQAFIQQLEFASQARHSRIADLEAAFQQDTAQSGAPSAIDQQQLIQERENTQQIDALLARLRPMANSIGPGEARLVGEALKDVDQIGSFRPSSLARAIVQIDGSSRGLPAEFIATTQSAVGRAAGFEQRVDALEQQLAADANANGGNVNQLLKQQLIHEKGQVDQLHGRIRGLFDAAADPQSVAQASAKLQAATSKGTVAEALAALG